MPYASEPMFFFAMREARKIAPFVAGFVIVGSGVTYLTANLSDEDVKAGGATLKVDPKAASCEIVEAAASREQRVAALFPRRALGSVRGGIGLPRQLSVGAHAHPTVELLSLPENSPLSPPPLFRP